MQPPEIWPDDGGHRGAHHAHVQPEDENGVQYDIQHRAGALDDHKARGVAGGLEDAFTEKLQTQAEGQAGADGEIAHARLGHRALSVEKRKKVGQANRAKARNSSQHRP